MRELIRNHRRFFLLATLAGAALRLVFLFRFPAITADSFIYGDIAKNWLQHGIYGVSTPAGIEATFIRLPGYPMFLGLIFSIFGMEHYRAALVVQILVDLGTCLLIADMTRRMVSERAAKTAFLLAAVCPFLANYSAAALTETLEIFFTVLALDCAVAGVQALDAGQDARKVRPWVLCGLAIGAAILLRPDGGILLGVIAGYLGWLWLRRIRGGRAVVQAGLMMAVMALAPLLPWTLRNLHTFHRVQPLAPRYANEENEFVPMGFNRWTKTWMADYVSVEEIYWAVPGSTIEADKLPSRAFDSEEQQQQTSDLLDDYNQTLHITPELDKRFAALATERIRAHALRYYVELPLVRIADMWLRPRTEILPSDTRWWEFDDDPKWSALAVAIGAINLFYFALAGAGLLRKFSIPHLSLLLTFVVIRSAFLGTLENPEPRYTLECYPVLLLLASLAWARSSQDFSRSQKP